MNLLRVEKWTLNELFWLHFYKWLVLLLIISWQMNHLKNYLVTEDSVMKKIQGKKIKEEEESQNKFVSELIQTSRLNIITSVFCKFLRILAVDGLLLWSRHTASTTIAASPSSSLLQCQCIFQNAKCNYWPFYSLHHKQYWIIKDATLKCSRSVYWH